jgi:hypothetical protein
LSTAAPPQPAGWTTGRFPAKFTVTTVVLAIVAVPAALTAVASLFQPEPSTVPITVLALWLVHFAGFIWHVRWPPRRPTGNATLEQPAGGTSKGIRFRYSRRVYYWFTAFMSLTMLLVLAIAGLFVIGRSAVGIAVAVVMVAVALLIGWFLLVTLRQAPGDVTVSPAGIFHRSLTFVHFVPWYAVVEVEARWLGVPVIVVKAFPSEEARTRSLTGRFHSGELTYLPFMVIRTYWLGTDPATVYHALAYYHAHPELRPELATPAAVDRIASGAATVQSGQ